MSVNVTINPEEEEIKSSLKTKLDARRTLDGSVIISDHPDIDIVVMPEKMKIVTFAKNSMDDSVYAAQSRLFDFLFRKGVVAHESIRGGNVYSSLEAKILPPNKKIPIDDIVLLSISNFIDKERPSFMYEKALEMEEEERLFEPDEEESTELGEVPQEPEKGSIKPHSVRRYVGGW